MTADEGSGAVSGVGRVWSFGLPVYLPSLLFGIGQGAIIPAIPFSVRGLGGSVAMAGFVVAVLGIGRVVGTLPAGWLVQRIGERAAMLLAVAVAAGALVLCLVAPTVAVLAAGVAVVGATTAVFGLARHAYLTEVAPFSLRARALATLGGVHRIGVFVGPFLGAAAIAVVGVDGGYWVHLGAAVLAGGALLMLPDVTAHRHVPAPDGLSTRPDRVIDMIRRHSHVLRTLGLGALVISAVRASRQVIIPLWAEHIGLDPATASVIFGISGGVDMLLFYPAGWVMDRFGRRWAVLPCMIVLGIAHVLIPLCGSAALLAAVAALMGFGNGIGSGIVMTMGSDASPESGRAVFLAAWRLLGDLGSSAGPFVLGGVAAVASLGTASVVVGIAAGLGALAMAAWLPSARGSS
jgi:MFS family permease